ncbi:MAG: DNA mismatch repair protein MutS [Nitrospinae bacterium]|nr:DNA mismatch repair protein MutS [Nitrospinota bacterium]
MSIQTPMMRQYMAMKKEHPDAILFFRMGDFYEMFGEDAVVASKAMNIALTSRDKGAENQTPMCGVPFHAVETYLARMIKQGFKVAICEQMEDPKLAKGIVKREVIRVVTPGAVVEPSMLDDRSHNFLAAVAPSKRGFGLAAADLSTGLLRVCEFAGEAALADFLNELDRIEPRQIIVPDNLDEAHPPLFKALSAYGKTLDKVDGWIFGYETARQSLLEQLKVLSLDGFGLEGMDLAIMAGGAAAHYLRDTQKGAVKSINRVVIHNPTGLMTLDPATRRNLELTKNLMDGGRSGSLLGLLDDTMTPMGGRILKEWILKPLLSVEAIRERHATVRRFFSDTALADSARFALSGMGDLERTAGRVALPICSPRDLLALGQSLAKLPALREAVWRVDTAIGDAWRALWDDVADLRDLLERAMSPDAPAAARDGGFIKHGYNERLDDLKSIQTDSRRTLLKLEEEEKARSGIANVKIKYNKVFGYFIEAPRRLADNVPSDWMRKQSVSNAERFISPKLKELEDAILNAEERALSLELELFEDLKARTVEQIHRAQTMAAVAGEVDTLAALGHVARRNGYTEPEVDDADIIEIKDGRHPILERAGLDERFVPNDALLDRGDNRLSIITGPNMAGKSTFIRQAALICLMGQMGSFVPAASAKIGVCDRIFTRVGAQDHLQRGQSTFMVEMNETAMILNGATARSLIVLDEIGRGTSTFDGISIAWAVAEYIHNVGARTLFATHYHELSELADSLSGVRNLSVAVREWNDEIIFLRKIIEGGADKSYGIQVARLAGLPKEVIQRAGEILTQLEANEIDASGHPKLKAKEAEGGPLYQLSMFAPAASEVEEELKKLDVNAMTPIEALTKLAELKKKAGG